MAFTNAPDPEMITKSATVVQNFTAEKYALLLSLLPAPDRYLELHNRYQGNYTAYLQGDLSKAKEYEADRQELNKNLSMLVALSKIASVQNAKISEELGVAQFVETVTTRAVVLTEPHNFRIVFTPKGQLMASIVKVPGAKGYQLWVCDSDQSVDANWRLLSSSTKCRGIEVSGLNRAKFNLLKIRGVRGDDLGPWSNIVSIPPA